MAREHVEQAEKEYKAKASHGSRMSGESQSQEEALRPSGNLRRGRFAAKPQDGQRVRAPGRNG